MPPQGLQLRGGERPSFACSSIGCGRKVTLPHAAGKYFLGRHCYDPTYQSQSEDKAHWALRRVQKMRKRLGRRASMVEPFPEKPKGDAPKDLHEDVLGAPRGQEEHLAGMPEGLDRLNKGS